MANTDILIVDDDKLVAELSKMLLEECGLTVQLSGDAEQALKILSQISPKLVITDIMLPGMSGLELCQQIKLQHPDIKVVVVSGKSYRIEHQRAKDVGAECYIAKPYDTNTFCGVIKGIMNGTYTPPEEKDIQLDIPKNADAQKTDLRDDEMRLTVWGSRAQSPKVPIITSKYGLQTSCVSIETSKSLLIFDAGSGIIDLGKEIYQSKRYYKDIWIFLSHFHYGNIRGLVYFKPLYDPAFSVNIVGPNDVTIKLEDVIQNFLFSDFSPAMQRPRAAITINSVHEESFDVGNGITISTIYANHPTTTLIYGVYAFGKKIVFAPDSEILDAANAFQDYNEKLARFAEHADIFVHDSTFWENPAEFDYMGKENRSRGHSHAYDVVEFSLTKVRPRALILYHVSTDYLDEDLDQMLENIRFKTQELNQEGTEIYLPDEGLNYIL